MLNACLQIPAMSHLSALQTDSGEAPGFPTWGNNLFLSVAVRPSDVTERHSAFFNLSTFRTAMILLSSNAFFHIL